jgi:hypothetical protein
VPITIPEATSLDLVIYAQLTFPVPAVIVAIVLEPDVMVVPVSPAPIVMVYAFG